MSFCYWEIFSDLDMGFGIGLASLSFCITCFTLFNLWKYMRFRQHIEVQSSVTFILVCMPLWGITHIAKLLFGLFTYAIRWHRTNHLPVDIQQYSKIFCVLDSVSTMILHGLLIILPYIWIYNLIGCILHNGGMKMRIRRYMLLLRLMKIYMALRFAIYFGLFIAEMIFSQDQEQLCKAINILIICQSALCVCLLLFCLAVLLQNFERLQLNHQNQKTQLLREFILVSIFCLVRFGINMQFIVINPNIECDFKTQTIHSIVYLFLGVITTHFIPILLILRLYNLRIDKNNADYQQMQSQNSDTNITHSSNERN